jgi:hypothetical protein
VGQIKIKIMPIKQDRLYHCNNSHHSYKLFIHNYEYMSI